jgi:hypothetical protein
MDIVQTHDRVVKSVRLAPPTDVPIAPTGGT